MATAGCFCFSHLTPALCPDDSLLLMRLPHEVLCLIPSEPRGVSCYQLAGGVSHGQHPCQGQDSSLLTCLDPPPTCTQPLNLDV